MDAINASERLILVNIAMADKQRADDVAHACRGKLAGSSPYLVMLHLVQLGLAEVTSESGPTVITITDAGRDTLVDQVTATMTLRITVSADRWRTLFDIDDNRHLEADIIAQIMEATQHIPWMRAMDAIIELVR